MVTHRSLPATGKSRLFSDEREARAWKLRTLAELGTLQTQSGQIAVGAHAATHVDRPLTVHGMLQAYLKAATLKPTTREYVGTLLNTKGTDISIAEMTYRWAVQWVASMKEGADRVRPGTIKSRVQTLRNALDWYFREYWLMAGMTALPANPLQQLPKNYSAYHRDDPERIVNTQRDRRLREGEEGAILAVIDGSAKRRCNRPLKARKLKNGKVEAPVDLVMLVRLLLNSALRLREAYRLRASDVNLAKETIQVRKSKLTDEDTRVSGERTLPMTAQLSDWLRAYFVAKGLRADSEEIVFPWWTGETDFADLRLVTSSLSQRLKAIFVDAGCTNLTTHDLRHEATSRFCEMRYPDGTRMYTKDELMTFTGHTEEATFERYKKLFTEDITPRALLAKRELLKRAG